MVDQIIRRSDDQKMRNLLRLEELAQFLACAITMFVINAPWWTYLLLLVGPDISMLGYVLNTRVGGTLYNIFHHKTMAVVIGLLVPYLSYEFGSEENWLWQFQFGLIVTGLILYGHASMDRMFGYGLKFGDSFQHTHLGWIGKLKAASSESASGQ